MTESAERMFQNFIDLAHENSDCPLCERALTGAPLKEFITKVTYTNVRSNLILSVTPKI